MLKFVYNRPACQIINFWYPAVSDSLLSGTTTNPWSHFDTRSNAYGIDTSLPLWVSSENLLLSPNRHTRSTRAVKNQPQFPFQRHKFLFQLWIGRSVHPTLQIIKASPIRRYKPVPDKREYKPILPRTPGVRRKQTIILQDKKAFDCIGATLVYL